MKSCFIFQVIIGLTVFDCHIFNEHRHARKEIKLSLPDSELPVTSRVTLPKMCPDMEFFWSVFSRIWAECRDLRIKPLYSVQIRKNTGQKISMFGNV